jgi:phosphatidylglycerophosphate synthase
MSEVPTSGRRPLKTRQSRWAPALALWLAARGVAPNAVSLASVVFALLAGGCLWLSLESGGETCGLLLVAAAAFVQLRLLCNLLDGLIAVEGGLGGPVGEIYNDLPDRIADVAVFVGAGLALRALPYGMTIGWLAAVAALLTAYVRVLGGAVGLKQDFGGPMAKQHRMAVVTGGCLASAVESAFHRPPRLLYLALAVVVLGSAVTFVKRTARIARGLRAR